MRNVVTTTQAPNAIGPYSQAIRAGQFIFVAGQVALDPATQRIVDGDVRRQTERVLKNIAAILEAAGSSMSKVVRCVVFLNRMSDFEAMNEVYGRIFDRRPPARTTLGGVQLPKGSLLEIEATALE
jgi:2-iminobutanoate/2-iminopropanoate deaminase